MVCFYDHVLPMPYSASYTFPLKNIAGSLLYHLIAIKREQIINSKIRIRVIIYGPSFSAGLKFERRKCYIHFIELSDNSRDNSTL